MAKNAFQALLEEQRFRGLRKAMKDDMEQEIKAFQKRVDVINDPKLFKSFMKLGVKPRASLNEAAAQFKQQARQAHPDLNPHDPKAKEKMTTLNIAMQRIAEHYKKGEE